MRYRSGALLLVGLLVVGCQPASSNTASKETKQPVKQLAEQLEFIEIVTAGGDPKGKLPLIVAMHGMGDRPENFIGWLQGLPFPARVVAPRAPLTRGRGFSWFPVTIPYDPDAPQRVDQMRRSTDQLAALVAHLQKIRPTVGKPVITGFSQGGFLSYAVASWHPELIAGAVPISGGLPKALLPTSRIKQPVPVFALHGDADPVVPIKSAKLAVSAMRKAGVEVQLQTFKGVRHTISRAMRQAAFERLATLTSPD